MTYAINVYRRLEDGKPYVEVFQTLSDAEFDFYGDDWRGKLEYVHTIRVSDGKPEIFNLDDLHWRLEWRLDQAREKKHETSLRNWRSM